MTRPRRHDGAGEAAATSAPSASRDPVPRPVRDDLDRIRRRWAELPVARAEQAAPAVRRLVEEAAARTAPEVPVPDLGAAVLPDQLTVVVWDAYAQGRGDGLAEAVSALRRGLP
ncbi:hypothetical protein JQN72_00540 [Phycicoccus sp. CSK15P-2]|uniref:hypothetical protein n=1 Tax=Phycicoccus sp. CSK15P-2 TaxID=2807627 RepID=UPI001950A8F1|nr:hypothetical protein [Phycicoccus sp. CSK15P-2]MBM6402731.1 hypothetical protein [Phycicoccus sp. CSK15P-2]